MMSPQRLVESLERVRLQFGAGQEQALVQLLDDAGKTRLRDAALLARLHEALLFVRAYPASKAIAARADALLSRFAPRVREVDASQLEEPEISGIAGTGLTAVFMYAVARRIAEQHPGDVRIAWDACDDDMPWYTLLPHVIPPLEDEATVDAHVPYREWVAAAAGTEPDLAWLMRALEKRFPGERERSERYDALKIPVRWEPGESYCTRTLMRLPARELFLHTGPLIRRAEISLDDIVNMPPLAARKLGRDEGELMLRLALGTSAVRYRQLHGFNYGDPKTVVELQAGRGVTFYFSKVLAERRLPLRDYLAATIWKNGVPIGYFEGLITADRMEAGFNVYYTFREGETAWLYRQLLAACRQLAGIRYCVLDPYQIGDGNSEAIDSGTFWFYRKLGFRSMDEGVRRLTAREDRRIAARPGYRSPATVLRRLVRHPMVYELPGAPPGFWDGFSVRNLGLSIVRKSSARGGSAELARVQDQLKRGKTDPRALAALRDSGLKQNA